MADRSSEALALAACVVHTTSSTLKPRSFVFFFPCVSLVCDYGRDGLL